MRKIKHSDLAEGVELPYLDPKNEGWFGVIKRVFPVIIDCPGRGWARYRICQRGPHGLSEHGADYTIGQINRTFRLA